MAMEFSSRRMFLGRAGAGSLAALLGCTGDRPAGLDPRTGGKTLTTPTGGVGCPDPFAEGEYLGSVPFVGSEDAVLGVREGEGWDARLAFDLGGLADGDALDVDPARFFVRTEQPDLLTTDPADWRVAIDGLVDAPTEVHIDDIRARAVDIGSVLLECSGNGASRAFGLMSSARWAGARLLDLIDDFVTIDPAATRVLVTGFDEHSVPSVGGHSTPGASWIFSFAQLSEAILATDLGGAPLPPDHGAPVRLLVPGWYGCCNIKWVTGLTLVDDAAAATSQMVEFADRTHQEGVPALARDYRAASMQISATPIRVEKWRLDGALTYRVVGILWGGDRLVSELRFFADDLEQGVTCWEHVDLRTWNLWSHVWRPGRTGSFWLRNRVAEEVDQIRLDLDWYGREVEVDEI